MLAGNTGPTAPWLAAALAMNLATSHVAPYMVGVQEAENLLLAVISPYTRDLKETF